MEIENKIILALVGAIGGVYAWVAKHILNYSRHANPDEMVNKWLCNERHDNMQKLMKEHKIDSTARYDDLKGDMKKEFAEIKQLIRANGGK